MSRVWTLMLFFTRDLFGSLMGIVPLGLSLAFALIAFEYGMDQAQFITVGGVGIGAICVVTTLLLASRANRGSSYLLVARLPQRVELLLALVLNGLGITGILAIAITAGNLLANRLALDLPSALWILPTWLALWLSAAALALPLSQLVSRGGSHLVGYALLAGLLVANDRKALLLSHNLDLVVRIVGLVLWPVNTLLAQASAGSYSRTYFVALALTLAYGGLLFGLAAVLFEDKDLLWTE
jgi:hypothetical protein